MATSRLPSGALKFPFGPFGRHLGALGSKCGAPGSHLRSSCETPSTKSPQGAAPPPPGTPKASQTIPKGFPEVRHSALRTYFRFVKSTHSQISDINPPLKVNILLFRENAYRPIGVQKVKIISLT